MLYALWFKKVASLEQHDYVLWAVHMSSCLVALACIGELLKHEL